MAKPKKSDKEPGRRVVRKSDQLTATLRDPADAQDFCQRLRAKCEEAGMKVPPMLPIGAGAMIAIACKSRDQAIFLLDFAQEALAEMPK